MKVFLGGTIKSNWRNSVIPRLKIDYFNPVSTEWNDETKKKVAKERNHADYCLYVITPLMQEGRALDEIREESFKRPDRIIFTYLSKDEDKSFSPEILEKLQKLKSEITANGAIYFPTIDETVDYLNSITDPNRKLQDKKDFTDCFISYGRRHSLTFARNLFNKLKENGISAWFDMNDIPLAVDFQEQIDEGIKKADNFLFVISPHSVKSEYCLKEIVLAIRYGKRIIPILHVEPSDCWDKMHPEIGKRNWIYMRQRADENIPQNEWIFTDNFDNEFQRMISVIHLHQDFTRLHTGILNLAVDWEKNQRKNELLLVGKDREDAEKWLLRKDFTNADGKPTQPPCLPTDFHAEYICESKKNGTNMLTDVFVAYSANKTWEQQQIIRAISRFAVTSWLHSKDIQKGDDFDRAILYGVEQADNMLFFITKESIQSEYCQKELEHAQKNNKRVIPLLMEKLQTEEIPLQLRNIQYIDFSEAFQKEQNLSGEAKPILSVKERVELDVETRREKSLFEKKIDELMHELEDNKIYYNRHKTLLVQALKWERQNFNNSCLLRGFNLQNAESWLILGEEKRHKPTDLHKKYITESRQKVGLLRSEVFISYSRKDGDFARNLNEKLQLSGKTTWFDQESIATGTDFSKEIKNGINQSDNFVFLISPDSVQSQYCAEEVEFAEKEHKRIITILCRKTNVSDIHPVLAGIQWIDFETRDFTLSFGELLRTLDTDREYVQFHTKLSQRAFEWQITKQSKDEAGYSNEIKAQIGVGTGRKSKDLLLRGYELMQAVDWQTEAIKTNKNPEPTEIQTNFIKASKRLANQVKIVKNISFILILILLFVSIILGSVNFSQKNKLKKAASFLTVGFAEAELKNNPTRSLRLAEFAHTKDPANTLAYAAFLRAYYSPDLFYYIVGNHKLGAYCVRFSQNGKFIVSAGRDKTVTLWKWTERKHNHTLTSKSDQNYINFLGHSDEVTGVDISPDNRFVVSCSLDGVIYLWNMEGEIIRTFTSSSPHFYSVRFVNKGEWILASGDNEINLWDLKGNSILSISAKNTWFFYAAMSPDNKSIVAALDNNIAKRWDIKGKLLNSYSGHKGSINTIEFSSDGKNILTASSDSTAKLWTIEGKEILSFRGHKGAVTSAAFSPDCQKIVTSSSDQTAILWATNGTNLATLRGHERGLNFATFSPKGDYIATASGDLSTVDNSVRIWYADAQKNSLPVSHTEYINCVVFSPDNKFVATAGNDNLAKITSLDGQKTIKLKHNYEVSSIAYSPNNEFIATSCRDSNLYVWKTDGTLLGKYHNRLSLKYVTVSPDNATIAVVADSIVFLWNKNGLRADSVNFKTIINTVSFSPDGKNLLLACNDSTVKICDAKGKIQKTIKGHKLPVNTAFYSSDGMQIISASEDKFVKIWDLQGKEISSFKLFDSDIYCAQLSPNGKYILAVSGANQAKIADLSGNEIITLNGVGQYMKWANFSMNGKFIATANSGFLEKSNIVKVWLIAPTELKLNLNVLHRLGKVQALDKKTKEKYWLDMLD